MKKHRLTAIISMLMAGTLLLTACGAPAESGDASADANSDAAATTDNNAGTEEFVDKLGATRPLATADDLPQPEDLIDKIEDGKVIHIGFVNQSESIQFFHNITLAIEDEAAKYGGKVEVSMIDPRAIAADQMRAAEDFVAKGVDAVIISAIDQAASAPALDVIVKAGIPCISLNTIVDNHEVATAYVGVDDKEAGIYGIQMLAEALGDKGIINVMEGLLGDPAGERRMVGIYEEMKNHPNLTIGSTHAADWDRGKAMNLTEDWLSGNEEFNAIFALNDEMAIPTANALIAAGRDDVLVIGIDALDEALEMIKAGKMYGTVFQSSELQGRGSLNVAVGAVVGEDIGKDYLIPYEAVTAENVDNYM